MSFAFLLAVLTIAAGAKLARPEVTSSNLSSLDPLPPGIPELEIASIDWAYFNQSVLLSWDFEGEWSAEQEGSITWFRPSGSGVHEFAYTRTGRGTRRIAVSGTGEALQSETALLLDCRSQGKILLVDTLPESNRPADCTKSYNDVGSIGMSGECWGQTYFEKGGGAWKRFCDKENDDTCSAVIYDLDEEVLGEPVWDCLVGQGRKKRWLHSDPGSHSAFVNKASSGCSPRAPFTPPAD